MHYRSVIIYCYCLKGTTTPNASRFTGGLRRRDGILRAQLFQRVVAEEKNLETERHDDMQCDEQNNDEAHRLRVSLRVVHVSQRSPSCTNVREMEAHRSENGVHIRNQEPP